MKRALFATAALLLSAAQAVTLSGSVSGNLPAGTRLGAWLVNASGAPVSEYASTPLSGNSFRLDLPDSAPGTRGQYVLRRENIAWSGVLDPVTVSVDAVAAELKFYVYPDANANGRRDEGEELTEVNPQAGRAGLLVVWVSDDTRVNAARGFEANLKKGWNVLSVELGKNNVKVAQLGSASLRVNVSR